MDDQEGQNLLRWEFGVEIHTETEKEYRAAMARLTRELMRDYTREQLAILIAARYVIFADARQAHTSAGIETCLEAFEDLSGAPRGLTIRANEQFQHRSERVKSEVKREAFRSETLAEDKARFAKTVLDAKHKQRARKAALASHKGDHANMAAALADWDASGHTYSTRRSFAKNNHKKYNVKDFTTVYGWLLKHRKLKN